MTKTAANSQEKKVTAASLSYAGNGIFCLRLKFSDESNCAVGVPAEDVENLIAQIAIALADDQLFFTAPNGRRFVCELSALREIKTLLCSASRTGIAGATPPTAVFSSEKNLRSSPSNFCSKSRGGSDAHVLGSRANAQLTKEATRTVRGAKKDSKASASKASASATRQFTRVKCDAQAPLSPREKKDEVSARAGETAKIFGEELHAVLSPILADLSTLFGALKAENAALKQILKAQKSGSSNGRNTPSSPRRVDGRDADSPSAERDNAKGNSLPKGWRKCAVENPSYTRVQTKRGRTSVIVARRKVS